MPPLSIETDNRRRDELGHLYNLQFIAEAGASSPNGICAEMVWFTGAQKCQSMTARTQTSTLTALPVSLPCGKSVDSTSTTELNAQRGMLA